MLAPSTETIANLIASLAARGRRVLFVAEKRAALEVVQRRLEEVDLGHHTLDLHGADLTRARVMTDFAESLRRIRTVGPVDPGNVHRDFEDRRAHFQVLCCRRRSTLPHDADVRMVRPGPATFGTNLAPEFASRRHHERMGSSSSSRRPVPNAAPAASP
jgi:hypothetical protein